MSGTRAVIAVAVDLLLLTLARAIHGNLIAYSGATLQYLSIFQPMLFRYGIALLLIYKQRGPPSGAAKAGVLLPALGSVHALCGGWAIGPLAAIRVALDSVYARGRAPNVIRFGAAKPRLCCSKYFLHNVFM